MGDISKNLSRWEFACHCGCGLADPHPVLCQGIQFIVDETGASGVTVTSGSRCDRHNSDLVVKVSAGKNSRHKKTEELGNYTAAADCVYRGAKLSTVLDVSLNFPSFANGGIGIYVDNRQDKCNRIHHDVRRGLARWGQIDGVSVSYQEALTELYRREGCQSSHS
jgi:hypothetical protein